MTQRLNIILALVLTIVVVTNPLVGFAAGKSSKTTISSKTDRVPAAPPRPLRPKRKDLQSSVRPAGQTTTLLPDGRLLMIGGEGSNGPITSMIISDPQTGATTSLPDMSLARAWHSATMLPDGRILILGGIGADGQVLGKPQIFDPRSQGFQDLPKSSFSPRAYHTATLLTDGRVLIVGGISARGDIVSSIETWDFKTKTARMLRAQLGTPRQKHQATLLKDGNVLIEGGVDEVNRGVRNSELFNSQGDTSLFTTMSRGEDNGSVAYLSGALPQDGATNVPVDTNVALRFSQPLDIGFLHSRAITLSENGRTVEAKLVPAESGRLVFLTPIRPLDAGVTYTISILNSNNKIPGLLPTSTSFTTLPESTKENGLGSFQPTDSDWTPGSDNFRGDWRSKPVKSVWQDQPALQGAVGQTALSGKVLTLRGDPLADVSIRIGSSSVRTDNTGRFLLTSVAAGHQILIVDGRTASKGGNIYGIFRAGVDLTASKTNVLPFVIWMPKLDIAHAASITSPTVKEVVITNPHIPGLELHLPAGTLIRDLDGKAVTEVSITAIPTNQPPFPLPPGVHVPTFFTIQPGGAQIIPPRAYVVYPNFTNEPAGSRINFWNYDPTEKGWYIYGQGTVTANGKQVMPDPGVVLYEFSGLMDQTSNPTPPPKSKKPGEGDDPPWYCKVVPFMCGGGGGGGGGNSGGSGGGNGPGTPAGGNPDGDPVDPGTGLFLYSQTDLFLPDTLPITLTRIYRPEDSGSRAFGIGSTHPFSIFLWGGILSQYQETNLILPDGGRIHYVRITPGTDYAGAVFEHTETPTPFYKSRIAWNGNGWNLTLKDGSVLVFGENAPLQSIRDRNGNQITITWSAGSSGNITQVTSPNGRWIQFTYDSSNRITQAKDNSGRTVGYTYDSTGRLWKVTNPNSGVTEYTYDSSHRMLTIKDPRGIVYLTNEYDLGGRVIKQTLADTETYEFDYTLNGSGDVTQTDITDQRGNIRRVTFNSNGFVQTDTTALGTAQEQTTTYQRQSGTNIISSVTDALGRTTSYTRDSEGYITQVTALAGTTNAISYLFTYEPTYHGIASITDPLNHTTTFAYDSEGNMSSATDALNHSTNFSYDSSGLLVSAADALNNTFQFSYDGGDLTGITDPLGHTYHRFVDSVGRVGGVTNPLGQRVRYEYDPLSRLTRITDALQGTTNFAYDANGNLLSLTDARNGVTSYVYDNMGRVSSRRDPLLHDTTYDYNADGVLNKVTDRKSQVTSYTHDPLNRLTQVTYADSSTTSLTYDAGNRLTQTVDSISGTTTFAYDNLDRLTSTTTARGTITYGYDSAGRRTSMTVTGQPTVNYSYDNTNRLTQVTQGTATITLTYDAAGRRSSLSFPNTVVAEYTYDNASQLTAVTYKLGTTELGKLTYTYDAAGQRTNVGGSYARTGLPQTVSSATYDAANRQTAFAGQSLTYDLNGNLTNDGSNTYSWNARNQLTSITASALTASFAYDAFGNRISKTVNSSTSSYLYDGVNVVQELSGTTPTANIITGGIDEVFLRTDGAGAWSPLTDALGSTLALTDSTGAVQTQYTYEPFGKTTVTGVANGNSNHYSGRENDGTSLYFYRGRYYSPTLQRFISEDPIGLSGGFNLYAYVRNNPMSYGDPFGLDPNGGTGGDMARALKDFVESVKDFIKNQVIKGAIAEAFVAAISITPKGLNHVLDRHVPGGVGAAGKSLFNAGEDITALIKAAENVTPVQQANGNWQRIIDAGRPIGIDRVTGQPTNIYTVITTTAGNLVTAFPGLP